MILFVIKELNHSLDCDFSTCFLPSQTVLGFSDHSQDYNYTTKQTLLKSLAWHLSTHRAHPCMHYECCVTLYWHHGGVMIQLLVLDGFRTLQLSDTLFLFSDWRSGSPPAELVSCWLKTCLEFLMSSSKERNSFLPLCKPMTPNKSNGCALISSAGWNSHLHIVYCPTLS